MQLSHWKLLVVYNLEKMLVLDLYTHSPPPVSFAGGGTAETGPGSLMLVSDHTIVPSRAQGEG